MIRAIGALLPGALFLAGMGCVPVEQGRAGSPVNSAGTAPAGNTASRAAPAAGQEAAGKPGENGLFPVHATGWNGVDGETLGRVERFAGDYAGYLAKARTTRQAVAGLVEVFAPGAAELHAGDRPAGPPGSRYWFVGPGGQAAAFVMLGRQGPEQGAHIVIASVDAPRIELKQVPVYDRAGFTMLDTVLHGEVDEESWLSRPLALHLYTDRPGARERGLAIAAGAANDEAVLVIPDLLPHLSGKVQRRAIVDSPERLDAIGASSRAAWLRFLASRGITESTLAQSEAALVPAGEAMFVGVDRGLLAGYGHGRRALAYAAVRALAEGNPGQKSAVVIVLGSEEGTTGIGFVKTALARVMGALGRSEADSLDTRRFYARSAVLMGDELGGELGNGLVLGPHSDDAVPAATRRVLDVLAGAGVAYQMANQGGRGLKRELSTWDMDVVSIGIASKGRGAPMELISTIDLYRARLAAGAWLGQ